jgi:SAM-dependent methyltransferase
MAEMDLPSDSESCYVEIEEEAEYQRQLKLFSECSQEKSIELVLIGEVISDLKNSEKFLDIGAGTGSLTISVSQFFAETTIIEPNERQAGFFRRRYPRFRVDDSKWEDADLRSDQFDFILCSHVLYYIPAWDWLKTIEKMYAHLAVGGTIAIILQSPIGEVAEFFRKFSEYDVPVIELWRDLTMTYGYQSVEVRYFVNEIFAETREDMVDLGLFLLLDKKYRMRKDGIERYFEERHKIDGGYRITQDEILLTIKRER